MSNFIIYIFSFLFLSIVTPSNAMDSWRQTTLEEYPSFVTSAVTSAARSSGGTSPLSDSLSFSRISSFCAPQVPSAAWYVSNVGNWVLQLKHHEYATIVGTTLKYRSYANMIEHYFFSVEEAKLSAEQWARADGILLTLKRR